MSYGIMVKILKGNPEGKFKYLVRLDIFPVVVFFSVNSDPTCVLARDFSDDFLILRDFP